MVSSFPCAEGFLVFFFFSSFVAGASHSFLDAVCLYMVPYTSFLCASGSCAGYRTLLGGEVAILMLAVCLLVHMYLNVLDVISEVKDGPGVANW